MTILRWTILTQIAILKFVLIAYPTRAMSLSEPEPEADRSRVVPVHQLIEMQVTDWSFRALEALVERYGCSTKEEGKGETRQKIEQPKLRSASKDNWVLTRYEFAVALKMCLNQIENQLAAGDTSVTEADLKVLARLQQEFATELSALRGRIEALEARTQKLKAQQFSTTTLLEGEVLFQLGDSFSDSDESQLFFGYRTRLNFDTSFTGADLLRVRLAARDIGELEEVEDTFMVRLGTDGESDDEVEVEASYEFPLGDRAQAVVGAAGVSSNDVAEDLNPLSSSGRGAVSRFGRRNPATLRGPGGAGGGLQYEFSNAVQGSIGYFASGDDAPDPSEGRGLFAGSYSAVAQLLVEPSDRLAFALTYTRTYSRADDVRLMGATGSRNANEPFGEDATSANNFGLQVNWEASDRFEIGGWFGYTKALQEVGELEATILNGALTLAFPDFLAEGNEAGIIIGVPPIVIENDNPEGEDERTSLHIEALYRIQVSDQIEITPGVFLITDPDHSDRDPIWVGTLRTRFSF